jgi:hypothetical protein
MFRGNVSNSPRKVSDVNRGEGTSGIKTQKKGKHRFFRRGALSHFRGRPQKNQTLGLAF